MRIEHLAKKREAISEGERHVPGCASTMISKSSGASGFFIGSWEAISKGERHALGPASAMTSKGSRSMSDLRTMGSTEATMVSTEALPN